MPTIRSIKVPVQLDFYVLTRISLAILIEVIYKRARHNLVAILYTMPPKVLKR